MQFTHARFVLITAISLLTVVGCNSHHEESQASTIASHTGTRPVTLNANNVDVGMTLVGAPKVSADGKNIAVTVDLSNNGTTTLSSSAKPPIHLGAHSVSPEGKIVNHDLARASFSTLIPGHSVHVTILLPVSGILGDKAQILPVQESVAWFDKWGTKPLVVGPFVKCNLQAHSKVCDANGKPLATMAPSK